MSNSYSDRYQCSGCGAILDPGERCFDCFGGQKNVAPELEPPKATNEIIAPLLYGENAEKSRGEDGVELISLIQEPIIEEHLRTLKDEIETMVADAVALVCTEETIQSVKATRSALNKRFEELEDKRKAIKAAVLDKYNSFEAVYKECVTTPFKRADLDLKKKVSDVEVEMKRRCENALREYFLELCEAHHIDFVPYERLGITISMADAKAKTQPPKKLREQVTQFITGVARSVETISEMENADEIMQEYKRILDAASAIGTVLERHRRIEEEKAAREARAVAKAQEAEAVRKVEAFAPPTVVQTPVEAPTEAPSFAPPTPVQAAQDERIYKCKFTAFATKAQLKRLKEFMNTEGIRYE